MSNVIRQYLTEQKYTTASDETYSHIDEWLDWYQGDVPNFHTYTIYNGVVSTKQKRYRLGMAKTVCEDWANLLLNEKAAIKAGSYDSRLNEILERNNFRVRGNQLVELAIIVGCKIAVVFTLWVLFFNPSKRPQQSPETVADGVLGPAEAPPAATTPPPAP